MKPLNQYELENIVSWIFPQIEGAQLQEVFATGRGLVLCLYMQKSFSLLIDLQTSAPFLGLFTAENCPWHKSKQTKPVGLFLNSHAKNLFLTKMSVESELGRVIQISLQNKHKVCELKIHAVPRLANLKVSAEGKAISWQPWKELDQNSDRLQMDIQEARSVSELMREWQQSLNEKPSKKNASTNPLVQLQKDLQKKIKARAEIVKTIEMNTKESENLYLLGEEFKQKKLEDFKNHPLEKYVNFKTTLSANREKCFATAKALIKKNEGAGLRIKKLDEEILSLEGLLSKFNQNENSSYLYQELLQSSVQGKSTEKHKIFKQSSEIKSRKLVLESKASVYMGKSAKDNLALLRQARSWDYWLHLRDYPGAHAIIHREKNQSITTKEFQLIARWLAEESLSSKSLHKGIRLDMVVAEVRFVRPIKGDKHGKVNYHSEKTMSFVY